MSPEQKCSTTPQGPFTLEQADQLARAMCEYLVSSWEQYQHCGSFTKPGDWLATHHPHLLPYTETFARVLLQVLERECGTTPQGE